MIPDPPVEGLFEFLFRATLDFEVHVFSSRSNQDGGLKAMRDWFMKHAKDAADRQVVLELKFPTEKPPAFIGIDDRVLTFRGSWPSIEELKNFKPWNAKGV